MNLNRTESNLNTEWILFYGYEFLPKVNTNPNEYPKKSENFNIPKKNYRI